MNRKEALEIYHGGPEVVTNRLIDLSNQVNFLKKTVESQQKTIAKLSKNSSNSSKPPSSDDITKPKSTKKKNKKRNIGGQKGHPIHERTSYPKEAIDKFYDYNLDFCPICSGDIILLLDRQPRIIQQVELEKVIIKTEEHRSYPYWCERCQQIHFAAFPPEIVKQGLFKARITALVAYMSNVCHASFSTIRKFIRDILGEKISRGYLAKIIQKVSVALQKPYEQLLNRLPLESTLNVDETGHKENGDRFWTWVFKAELYVLFKIDKSRGSKVLIEVLGKEFDGILGCDYFSAYRKYMKDFSVSIQFCIAHLIRDIKFLTGLPDAQTKAYGEKLLKSIKKMFKVIYEKENMTPDEFKNALKQAKESILKTALENVPSHINEDGKEQKKEAQNMANRFRQFGASYFTFITTPGIDPTNNVAERAIRFVVIDRHIKQGTRSIKGRKANERLWTVIATCELQGRSAFNFILKAVEAHFYDKPPPSLLFDTS
jgi:transposase